MSRLAMTVTRSASIIPRLTLSMMAMAANDPVRTTIASINQSISKLDDGSRVHYLDIGAAFLDAAGNIPTDVMSDGLHPTTKGYEIWAKAVSEPLTKLMTP